MKGSEEQNFAMQISVLLLLALLQTALPTEVITEPPALIRGFDSG